MIYNAPAPDDPIDQGDLVESCPVLSVHTFSVTQPPEVEVRSTPQRVVVLTQTCDLAKHFADTFSRIGLPKPYETL